MRLQLNRSELKEALSLWVENKGINGTIKDFVVSKSVVVINIAEPQPIEPQIPSGQIPRDVGVEDDGNHAA